MLRPLFTLLLTLAAATLAAAEPAPPEMWPSGEGACLDSPLRLTFFEPVQLGSRGKLEVCRAADGVVVETVTPGGPPAEDRFGATGGFLLRYEPIWIDASIVQVRLHRETLKYGEAYFVRITPGFLQNGPGHDWAGVTEGWKFQVKAALPRNPDRVTVASNGQGDFCTVQGAVDAIEPHRTQPATVFIRRGYYRELVRIGRERRHVHLVGEDRQGTVIAGLNNEKLNPGWIQRAVLGVEGDDFVLEHLTVRNLTPYQGSQAEAVYVNAERCVLRNADFQSLQDTLHLSGRVYVENCRVEGDVDYVWGYGTAGFVRCEFYSLHNGYLVQARNAPGVGGYVFLDCALSAAAGVDRCWLARIESARFPASHVAFLRCRMGTHIPPAGWQVTGPASAALRFEEWASTDLAGKPLDLSKRDSSAKPLAAEPEGLSVLSGNDGWKPWEKVAQP